MNNIDKQIYYWAHMLDMIEEDQNSSSRMKNIDYFVEHLQISRNVLNKLNSTYENIQKHILKTCLKYFLDGGYPMGRSSAMCGLLTNDDVGTLVMYKNDSANTGSDFNGLVKKAVEEFGQIPHIPLYRGIGSKQTNIIVDRIRAGKRSFSFENVQSFTGSMKNAETFAALGGGSRNDEHHGEGSLVIANPGKMTKLFYLDEFSFYSVLSEIYWREIANSTDIQQYTSEFYADDILEEIALEQEWLLPAGSKLNIHPANDNPLELFKQTRWLDFDLV